MERKKDLSHLMIKTYFFLQIFARSLPATDAVFPSLVNELKVTGICAKRADSPRFHTFPDFCLM